jgi:hypothetical protein
MADAPPQDELTCNPGGSALDHFLWAACAWTNAPVRRKPSYFDALREYLIRRKAS